MALKLLTPPAVEPISLEEAKMHVREDFTDQDPLLLLLIKAARQHLDNGEAGWLGRALINQTWQLTIDGFPNRNSCWWWQNYNVSGCRPASAVGYEIKIPFPPLQSVTSIKYYDTAGVQQTMSASDYTVDTVSEPGWVVPTSSWPSTLDAINAVTIEFVAGYGNNAEDVPADIRVAMLLTVGHLFANREATTDKNQIELPMGAKFLLKDYRVQRGMA